MLKADRIHKELIGRILTEGSWDENPRPRYASDGEPAYSKFITQVYEEYDISKGELPITLLRPIYIDKATKEGLWIYQDQTSSLEVLENKYGIMWWRDWEVLGHKDLGDPSIGQRYGATVRRYDLMNKLLNGLINDPFGRRHIMNLLQQTDLDETDGLHPCAFLTMWSVRSINGKRYLDLTLVQRSSDYLVAGHINMMQYVSLQMMVAHHCGYRVGKFARFTQNLHIYNRHIDQAIELREREPVSIQPELVLNAGGKSFYEITADDFELKNYHPIKPQLKFDLGI